jgi:hypothetical protein
MEHHLDLSIILHRLDWHFLARLCPTDSQPLRPFLETLKGKSTSWEKVGHNPEFNEARLADILEFLGKGA